jgi:hypothetical protein
MCVNQFCTQNTCKSGGLACVQGDTCCNNLVCNSFDSICEACGNGATHCTKTADCCNGFTCNLQTSFCQGMAMCKQPGMQCAQTPDCCSGVCNGFDLLCEACGAAANVRCNSDADCCGGQGWTCNMGTNFCWMKPMCSGQGTACMNTAECCQGLYCDQGLKCTNAPMCKIVGAACAQYTDCCAANSMDCVNSACCIEKMYQSTMEIRCYANSDCCNNELCNVMTGACQ